MKRTFEIKSYSLESFVCALLLMFLSFSILPISISIIDSPNETESEFMRVYVAKDENISERKNETNVSKSVALPISNSATTSRYKSIETPALDFKSLDVGEPNLSVAVGFSISSFGAGNFSGDSGKIIAFALDSLDKIPARLNSVKINYPRDLLRRGVEGEVRLNVIIDEAGNLQVDSVASSTNTAFESAAIVAASKLKYETPTRNGKPVRACFILPIPFKIIR